MLGDKEAIATIAVKGMAAARRFYEGVVGLRPVETGEEGVLSLKSGNSTVLVYESRYAGTNKATVATWVVADVEAEVQALKGKGVVFEHYDNLPGATRKGDVHHTGGRMKAAWFKDPDGNILALVGE
jgi:catechol 2,3-dioxygenase-like lactoylglutathione lyase family enzyme